MHEERCSASRPIFNSLSDTSFSSSSTWGTSANSHGPERSRLFTTLDGNGISSWHPDDGDVDAWIQADLLQVYVISKISTRGRDDGGFDQYVKAYRLQYSTDAQNFESFWVSTGDERIFRGNRGDRLVIVLHTFEGVSARYVRLILVSGSGLQWEIYVCSSGKFYD